ELPLHGEEFRRSVYVQVRRSLPLGFLETLDAPAMEPNCECRRTSTTAPQSLLFLNNQYVVEQARDFAARLRRGAGADPRRQVVRAWRLVFTREPSAAEVQRALAFLQEQRENFRRQTVRETEAGGKGKAPLDPELRALASLCQTFFCANEFLYID